MSHNIFWQYFGKRKKTNTLPRFQRLRLANCCRVQNLILQRETAMRPPQAVQVSRAPVSLAGARFRSVWRLNILARDNCGLQSGEGDGEMAKCICGGYVCGRGLLPFFWKPGDRSMCASTYTLADKQKPFLLGLNKFCFSKYMFCFFFFKSQLRLNKPQARANRREKGLCKLAVLALPPAVGFESLLWMNKCASVR